MFARDQAELLPSVLVEELYSGAVGVAVKKGGYERRIVGHVGLQLCKMHLDISQRAESLTVSTSRRGDLSMPW